VEYISEVGLIAEVVLLVIWRRWLYVMVHHPWYAILNILMGYGGAAY
jgi:hypothetical protein